jgi:hypothetical protein
MNKLQKSALLWFLPVLIWGGCGGNSQEPQIPEKTKIISLKIEKGTSLTYKVSQTEVINYTMEITFRELEPVTGFDYFKTNLDYSKGHVEIAEKARKYAKSLQMDLDTGSSSLSDKTAMMLSLESYRDLLEAGRVTLDTDKGQQDFFLIKNEDFRFEKGSATISEKTMHCANREQTIHFWVWKNPELPLILKYTAGETALELTYWYLPGEKN